MAVFIFDSRNHWWHLHSAGHRHDVPNDGLVKHGRFVGIAAGRKPHPNHRRCICVHHNWCEYQACSISTASMAPQRLHVFAVCGLRLSGSDCHKGILLCLGATIFRLWGRFNDTTLDAILLPLSLAAMFIGSIAAITKSTSAIAGVLEYRPNRVHDAWAVLQQSEWPHRWARAILTHGVMKGGLFLVVGCITYKIHSSKSKTWLDSSSRDAALDDGAFVRRPDHYTPPPLGSCRSGISFSVPSIQEIGGLRS